MVVQLCAYIEIIELHTLKRQIVCNVNYISIDLLRKMKPWPIRATVEGGGGAWSRDTLEPHHPLHGTTGETEPQFPSVYQRQSQC